MTITLTPEQKAWIDAHVARGDYASAEDAWAEPLVDEALAQVERGEIVPGDVVMAELRVFVESMKR